MLCRDRSVSATDINVWPLAWSHGCPSWSQSERTLISRDTLCKHLAVRKITIRAKNNRWMTSELHKLSRQKHRLFRILVAKRVGTRGTWEDYKYIQLGIRTVKLSRWRNWMPVWSSLIAEKLGADTEWLRRWPRVRAVSFPVSYDANLRASSASLKFTTAFLLRMIQLSSSSARTRRDHSCDR